MIDYVFPLRLTWDRTNRTFDAYVATFGIGQLAIQIFAYRWTEGPIHFNIPGRWDQACFRIWPGVLRNRNWPPAMHFDRAGMKLFSERWLTLTPDK